MPRLETVQLVNREAQVSNAAIYRKDLPRSGYISAIDVGVRITNGGTPPADMELVDIIKHISLVVNGTDYRIHISGPDLFRLNWLMTGRPMPYVHDETADAVQEVWFRLPFGRYLGDVMYGLNLARYANVQLQIDYDASAMGIADTHFVSGSVTFTILLHAFPLTQAPTFRGMLGLREIWTYTTVGGNAYKVVDLPNQNHLAELFLVTRKDAVAEGTCVSEIRIGRDNFNTLYYDGYWYNFQTITNHKLIERTYRLGVMCSSGDTRHLPIANITTATAKARTAVGGAA